MEGEKRVEEFLEEIGRVDCLLVGQKKREREMERKVETKVVNLQSRDNYLISKQNKVHEMGKL